MYAGASERPKRTLAVTIRSPGNEERPRWPSARTSSSRPRSARRRAWSSRSARLAGVVAGRRRHRALRRDRARPRPTSIDELGKMVVSQIQLVDGITRTLTCPVVQLCRRDRQPLQRWRPPPGAALVAFDRELDEAVEQLRVRDARCLPQRGYIEIGVKPGIVLSSLTRNRAVGVVEEEVDARHRLAPARLERARPRARALRRSPTSPAARARAARPCRLRTCRRSRRTRRRERPRRAATPPADRRRARRPRSRARRSPPRRRSTRRTRARVAIACVELGARRAPSTRRPTSPCSPASRSTAARARPRPARRTRRRS